MPTAGEGLAQFVEIFSSLLDEFASDEGEGGGGGGGGGGGERRGGRGRGGGESGGGGGRRKREGEGGGGEVNGDLPPPREVRAGGKRFYFDVASNDRGTFIKLSEVKVRCTHIHSMRYSCSTHDNSVVLAGTANGSTYTYQHPSALLGQDGGGVRTVCPGAASQRG